jgi:hypothetical protein
VELVPKIGVGIIGVHGKKMRSMYHTGKNGVKAGKTLTRIIHECRREAFETEARQGFSHVRPTQAYVESVEEAEREKPRRARGSGDVAGIHE